MSWEPSEAELRQIWGPALVEALIENAIEWAQKENLDQVPTDMVFILAIRHLMRRIDDLASRLAWKEDELETLRLRNAARDEKHLKPQP